MDGEASQQCAPPPSAPILQVEDSGRRPTPLGFTQSSGVYPPYSQDSGAVMVSFVSRFGGVVVASAALVVVGAAPALASFGCDWVNQGNMNISDPDDGITSTFSNGITGDHFDVGDTLHATSTVGTNGSFVYLAFGVTAYVSRVNTGSTHNDDVVVTSYEANNFSDNFYTQANSQGGTTAISVTCTPVNPPHPPAPPVPPTPPEPPAPPANTDSPALDSVRSSVTGQNSQGAIGIMTRIISASAPPENGGVLTALDVGQAVVAKRIDFASIWAGLGGRGVLPNATGWLGVQGMGAAGINVDFTDTMIGGVFVTAETGRYVNATQSVGVQGFGIGTNFKLDLPESWRIEAVTSYTALGYALQSGAVTGSFGAHRLFGELALSGSMPMSETVRFEPRGSLFVLYEAQDGYTDSASVAHAAAALADVNGNAGGRFVYAITDDVEIAAGAYGKLSAISKASVDVEAGIGARLGGGAKLSIMTGLDTLGGTTGAGYWLQGRLSAEF